MGKGSQGPRGNFTQVDPTGQTKSHKDFTLLPKGWMVVKAKATLVCFSDHCLLAMKAEMGHNPREAEAYGS